MSLLPPPRPPSLAMVSFISIAIANGKPGDWAKTSAGSCHGVASSADAFEHWRCNFWLNNLVEQPARNRDIAASNFRPLDTPALAGTDAPTATQRVYTHTLA